MTKSRGFTLVEMLVATGLFGLLMAVVAPNAINAQKARQQSSQLRLIEVRLNGIGLKAALTNSPIDIKSALEPGTPKEWRIQVTPSDAYFDGQGFCNAQNIAIYSDESLLRRWDMRPPICQVP